MALYLSIEEALAIHEEMIEVFGGREGVRDFTLLHSAVERSRATFGNNDLYPTIFEKAAALISSLILNHPFDDGNKRTAITSYARFLSMNGYNMQLPFEETVRFTLDIDAHRSSFTQIVEWITKQTKIIKK